MLLTTGKFENKGGPFEKNLETERLTKRPNRQFFHRTLLIIRKVENEERTH